MAQNKQPLATCSLSPDSPLNSKAQVNAY